MCDSVLERFYLPKRASLFQIVLFLFLFFCNKGNISISRLWLDGTENVDFFLLYSGLYNQHWLGLMIITLLYSPTSVIRPHRDRHISG